MGNYKEDKNQNFRTIFFLILFSLFILAFSFNQGTHYSISIRYSAHYELEFGNISSHHNAIICNAFRLPDFQKYCDSTPLNTSLNPFSIQNIILQYNRRIAQNFIQIQKTRLSIKPIFTSRLFFHLPSNNDDDLPVLS
jgi:hypothetical protein